jgi:hypothetical protein
VTGLAAALQRHRPVVRYDSHEVYFADSAAEWTDNPGHSLRAGATGAVLAQAPDTLPTPPLSLAFLGPSSYADGTKVDRDHVIGCPSRDYAEQARRLHAQPGYPNRVYGRWAPGSDRAPGFSTGSSTSTTTSSWSATTSRRAFTRVTGK